MSNAPINRAFTNESPINEASKSSSHGLNDKKVQQVLLTLLLGGTVVSFSNSALNPAIPVFMSVFDVDIVMGGWVLNAYVL
ncbi:MAG: MFS transporter, partial [Psychrobacter sp.]